MSHRALAALGSAKRGFLPNYSLVMCLLGQGFVFNFFFAVLVSSVGVSLSQVACAGPSLPDEQLPVKHKM